MAFPASLSLFFKFLGWIDGTFNDVNRCWAVLGPIPVWDVAVVRNMGVHFMCLEVSFS